MTVLLHGSASSPSPNCKFFNAKMMKHYIGRDISSMKTSRDSTDLSRSDAEAMAAALLRWADDNGCTHFTHSFAPMTNRTANKLMAIRINAPDGVRVQFDASQLVCSETDGSSFPHGGLRSTMEARGITSFDLNATPFIKDTAVGRTLFIPSTFRSFRGESLDHRDPLNRSTSSLRRSVVSILSLLEEHCDLRAANIKSASDVEETGADVSYAGPEQEYFLIRESTERQDIRAIGRCLFGSLPRSHSHHYFNVMPLEIAGFLRDVDQVLRDSGVPVECHHNEVAPRQFELACRFAPPALAAAWNLMIKDTLEEVAKKHGLRALLHSKPFANVNGSGMHVNWSLNIGGINVFSPPGGGESSTSIERALFLLAIACTIRAVDEHQSLLRSAAANSANDLRLGGNEAPPGLISVFLGTGLAQLMDSLTGIDDENETEKFERIAYLLEETDMSAVASSDVSDRNRTSPFAFTGQKFEFRMPGSEQSVAYILTIMQTMVAASLEEAVTDLKTSTNESETGILHSMVEYAGSVFKKHRRIVYNFNNYCDEWVNEAASRGLSNHPNTVSALKALRDPKTVSLFTKMGVLSPAEVDARLRVCLHEYCTNVENEVSTFVNMVERHVFCDTYEYLKVIPTWSKGYTKLETSLKDLDEMMERINVSLEIFREMKVDFDDDSLAVDGLSFLKANAAAQLRTEMQCAADVVSTLEGIVGHRYWSLKTYEDILKY